MKRQTYWIAGGLAVVLAVVIIGSRPGSWRPESTSGVVSPVGSTRVVPQPSVAASRFHGDSLRTRRSRDQLKLDTIALVHEKLRVWNETLDLESAAALMNDLTALLNNENAADIVRSLSAEDLDGPFGTVAVERWLAADFYAAAAWMAARPDITDEQAALVARKLLEDRTRFDNYFDRLPSGDFKEKILGAVGVELVGSNPQEAISLARLMKPGETRLGLMQSAAFEWARRDPSAAVDWLNQIDDPALREPMIAWGAKGYASTDPRAAAEWLVASLKPGELLNETAASIVRSWAGNDPAAAADWVVRFPDGALKDEALETLVSSWSAADSPAATAWAGRLPDGAARRKASEILARTDQANAGSPALQN